jgi:hypothetical protein
MNPQELPINDIHLPEAIGWWPLAPGWWVVVCLLLAVMVFLFWRWRKQQHSAREGMLEMALRELERLPRQYGKDSKTLLRELSVLLRRVAISRYGRQQVSGLTGMQWVEFLDKQAGKKLFQGRFEAALTELPYRPETQAETAALMQAIREWIRLQRGKSHE